VLVLPTDSPFGPLLFPPPHLSRIDGILPRSFTPSGCFFESSSYSSPWRIWLLFPRRSDYDSAHLTSRFFIPSPPNFSPPRANTLSPPLSLHSFSASPKATQEYYFLFCPPRSLPCTVFFLNYFFFVKEKCPTKHQAQTPPPPPPPPPPFPWIIHFVLRVRVWILGFSRWRLKTPPNFLRDDNVPVFSACGVFGKSVREPFCSFSFLFERPGRVSLHAAD